MKPFSMIVAMDSQRGIGRAGGLPWHLSGEMKHFRDVTIGSGQNAVIMGSVTWFSLPEKFRPLPQRLNIVLNRDNQVIAGALSVENFDQALTQAEQRATGEIFVIGGGSVYALAIQDPRCQKLYITNIEGVHNCDVFFPEFSHDFRLNAQSEPLQEGSETYRFEEYSRIEKAEKLVE